VTGHRGGSAKAGAIILEIFVSLNDTSSSLSKATKTRHSVVCAGSTFAGSFPHLVLILQKTNVFDLDNRMRLQINPVGCGLVSDLTITEHRALTGFTRLILLLVTFHALEVSEEVVL
jgi:hypothetical protein